MKMRRINYKSDIPPLLVSLKADEKQIAVPDCDFIVRFYIEGYEGRHYDCSHIGGVWSNCEPSDDGTKLVCYINNQQLGIGELCAEFHYISPNRRYSDGSQKSVVVIDSAELGVELVEDNWDVITEAAIDVTLPFIYRTAYEIAIEHGYTGTAEDFYSALASVVAIADAEKKRVTAEIARNANEQERIENEENRLNAENDRVNAEAQRVKNEKSFEDAIRDQVNNYKPIVIEGNVTNAADEEDITSENGLLKLKDRSALNGMGYVILRQNKNFAEQITKANTIYEIRYDFDLNGDEVQIKEGCVLNFIGGSLSNGSIRLNDCILHNERFINIKLNDVYNRQLNLARLYNEKNTKEVNQSIFKNCTTLYIPNGEYEFNYSIELDENSSLVEMFGDSAIKSVLKFNSCNGIIVKKHIKLHDIKIYGINCRGVYDANEMMFKGGFYGIDIQSGCKMYNLGIANFLIGMNIVQGHVVDAEFSSITLQYNSNAGMYILHDNNNQKNNCSFSHLYCVKNGYNVDNLTSNSTQRNCGFGLFIHGGYCNSFKNNVFEYNSGVGVYIKEPIQNIPFIGCSFINNYFERNKYANFIIQLSYNIHLCSDLLVKSNFFTEAGYDIVPDADIRRKVILEDIGIHNVSSSSISKNNIDIETFNFNYIDYDKMYNSMSVGVPLIKDELDKKYYFKLTKETPYLSNFELFNDRLEIGLYYLVITAKLGENTGRKLAIFTIPNIKYLSTNPSIALYVDSTEEKTTYLPIYIDSFKQILESLTMYFNEGFQDGESVFMNIELIKATSCTTEQLEHVTYLPVGYSIYNSTIEKIVTWDGSKWVSDNGIYKDKGSTSERPTLTSTDEGCEYYDSTLKKKILWNGTEWTNMDGSILT